MQRISSREDLEKAVDHLVGLEPRFRVVVDHHGLPSLRHAESGLQSLLRIVTDQLISLKAGEAIWRRVEARLSPLTSEAVLGCSEDELKALGLSGAKARAFHAAAEAFSAPDFAHTRLSGLAEQDVHVMLTGIRGIGPWTADIYLLSALQSANAWPAADLALQVAAADLLELETRPSAKEMARLAEPWHPVRAVAARLLWSHYRGLKQMPQASL